MTKIKKRFACNECGYVSGAWMGKCPECNSWNSFVEEIISNNVDVVHSKDNKETQLPVKIQEVQNLDEDIFILDNDNINIFVGSGFVPGSVILLSGEPGVGKSTFLFLLAKYIKRSKKIYYFSGEESVNQIKKRFDRVGASDSSLFVSNISQVEKINEICQKEKPMFVFVDSIQTCFSSEVDSAQGTISQIKKCTQILIDYAKMSNAVVIIVCHVTKSGEIAGPKIMEHMVDVVTYFESDYKNQFRILRSRKNRFGNIDEILVFEMKENGLDIIDNPSSFFIESENLEDSSIGKCKCVIIEGKRPVIVDIEALVVPSAYPMPKRFSEGIDVSRINRILAIIDKHLNENFNNYDVYTNISGGIRTSDIGIDLAIAVAMISSKKQKPIKNDNVFIGELSLTGGIKKVNQIEKRIKEAMRFGLNNVYYQDEKNQIKGIIFLKDYFQ